MNIEAYFKEITDTIQEEYTLANEARKIPIDPETHVEITLAKDMGERVMGLISTVAPQVKGAGIPERIKEYELEYGVLDWRVGFKIAEDLARQKLCSFETEREAMEVGIRTGFSYLTLGVVSSCLEGFTQLKIKKRRDGKEYFCLYFSGPIRNAGGNCCCCLCIDCRLY